MRTPWWLRWGRRLLPGSVWSGAGVIVRKVHREASTASAVIYDYKSTVVTEGVVADRWVLVVQDASDAEHYVNVAPQVWEGHQVGDVITAEDPLINLP